MALASYALCSIYSTQLNLTNIYNIFPGIFSYKKTAVNPHEFHIATKVETKDDSTKYRNRLAGGIEGRREDTN